MNNERTLNSELFLNESLARNTRQYFIFSALVALFIFTVLRDGQESSMLTLWLTCIEVNTIVLAIFQSISIRKKNDPFLNLFFRTGIIFNGLIWGSLSAVFQSEILTDSHVLVIMSLVAIVALGVPLFASSTRLVLIFSSAILVPSSLVFLSQLTVVSIGKSLVIASLIPVINRVVARIQEFQTRSHKLSIEHQDLIDQLNIAVEKSETTNLELKNEIKNKKKTESALIKARDDAEAAVKAKSEFLATMSHEIRTPMNGVLGMAELLTATDLSNKQQRFAETIHKSGTALLTIINDILDFSKIEAGKLELNESVFDLRLLIEELGVMFAEQAHRKKIALTCNYPAGGHSMFRGDAERIRQILVNLIGNALKFTESGDILVKVELFEKNNGLYLIRFRVKDSGIGITPAAQEKIFDSFSQADGTTTRRFGGTGLGLAICKMLAQLMKGKIGVQSQEGHGSTFWFTIPLNKEVAVKQTLNSGNDLNFSSYRLLIADSNKTNREVLEQQVSNWGMDFYSVDNGRLALQKIKESAAQGNPFTLAILDNQLPGIDGITLARKIKGDSDISDTKLIMLSSVGNMEQTGQWLMAGIESYLSKPIRQSELCESISSALKFDSTVAKNDKTSLNSTDSGSNPQLKGHILVAEDNIVNQELVREMLTQLGCSVEIVENGRKAVEAISENPLDNLHKPYDLILMDCQMPEMDGFEATQILRKWESNQKIISHIPIIALTANAMEGDREKCLNAGMDDYMTKPFNLEQLGALLHRWLPLLAKENESEYVRSIEQASEPLPQAKNKKRTPTIDKKVTQINAAAIDKIRSLQRDNQPNVVIKVLSLFLENSQKTVFNLESAISKGDHTSLCRAAASLRSSSLTVGALDLVKLCSEIISHGEAQDIANALSLLSILEFEYDAVCAALQKLIDQEMGVAVA